MAASPSVACGGEEKLEQDQDAKDIHTSASGKKKVEKEEKDEEEEEEEEGQRYQHVRINHKRINI